MTQGPHLILDPSRAEALQQAFVVWKFERVLTKVLGVPFAVALTHTLVKDVLIKAGQDVSKIKGLEHAVN